MKIKTITLFRLLSILTMGRIFLPIVFANIPFPFSSILFFAFVWVFACLFWCPNILFSKGLLPVYLLAIILFFGINSIWSDRIVGYGEYINYYWLQQEAITLYLSILIYSYFIIKKDYEGMAYVISFTLLFIFITCLTTIIGTYQYPMAARELTSGIFRMNNPRIVSYYTSIGIANYYFFTPLSFTMPVIIYIIKDLYKHNIKIILIFCIILFVFVYSIIQAKFSMALIFTFALLLISFFKMRNNKKYLITTAFIFLIFGIYVIKPVQYLSIALHSVSGLFAGTITEERLKDLAITIENPVIDHYSFAEKPIIGGGFEGGHNFWLDRLSMFGIIGIIPWILIVSFQIKNNLTKFDDDFRSYYTISMIAFIALGFINNIAGHQFFAIVFFILPGIYFLRFLKTNFQQK